MVRDHGNRLICRIDVITPTVFFVSFFLAFVLGGSLSPPHRTPVDLARVGNSVSMWRANREGAILVTVQRDGKVFFRTDPVASGQLAGRIHEAISEGADRKIYIQADARAKYGAVVEVIDAVHDARVENVALLVEGFSPKGAPAR
jgi:biopolymer transport protein ExbD/biopolymer transport protein TolR